MTPPRDVRQGWLLGGPTGVAAPAGRLEQMALFDGGVLPPLRLQVYRDGASENMSTITEELRALPAEVEDLGGRWAVELRGLYPRDTAKRVARDYDVSPRTAESWLAGQAPRGGKLVRHLRLHGLAALLRVMAPGTDAAHLARVEDLAADLESRLDALRDELVVLRGDA